MPTFVIAADAEIIVTIMEEFPNHAIRYSDCVITFVEPNDDDAISFALRYSEYIIAKTPRTLIQEYQQFVFAAIAGLH